MGPRKAAQKFLADYPQAAHYEVILYKSLAATGKGHLTDLTIQKVFSEKEIKITWEPDEELPNHPNGMMFLAFDAADKKLGEWLVYSIGGGALRDDNDSQAAARYYQRHSMHQILQHCLEQGITFSQYVFSHEDPDFQDFLLKVLQTMFQAVDNGLKTEGCLPGGIGIPRKAYSLYRRVRMIDKHFKRGGLLSAYALAVSEENACGGTIVTAPTCGSCGVVPSVLRYLRDVLRSSESELINALATAGLVGNLVKKNASISGAEVGCQGEIGTACAMAAAAAAQLMGGTVRQIEYAAEMGLEHHLGLTCDPVYGLVQIPCIERNAFAAKRAISCAEYALISDGSHFINFDDVVEVMNQTGNDLPSLYRETSQGGLAKVYKGRLNGIL
jgi:L-serine dehydratase